MLAILRSGKVVPRKVLAQKIEVTPREISRYRDDLELAGVRIREIRGKYGGYQLEGKNYLLELSLSKQEVNALNLLKGQITNYNFLYAKEIKDTIEKINAIEQVGQSDELQVLSKGKHVYFEYEIERDKWNKINEARISCQVVILNHLNGGGISSVRRVHPYGILKLKIDYPYARYFKENNWVVQERIQDYETEGYLIYEAIMEGKTQITSWILGMGMACTVLESRVLQDEIREIYRQCLEKI